LVAGFAALAPADRVALVSDSYALASAGRRPMAEHLALLSALPQVMDASRGALFALGLSQWRALDTALVGTQAMAPLRAAGIGLFAPELERLGWPVGAGEDSETQTLRSDLIHRLARFGHAPTLTAAHARFDAALAGATSVAPSMRAALLYAAGCDASDAEFEALLAALRTTQSQEERWNLLYALTAGSDPARSQRLLEEALSGRLPQDIASRMPGAVASQPPLATLAYDFVLSHWEDLLRLAGEGSFGARHWLLPSTASLSSDPAMARRLLLDQERLDGAAGASAAAQTAAAIESRSRLRERESATLASALAR
jgi:aminopeptidase N